MKISETLFPEQFPFFSRNITLIFFSLQRSYLNKSIFETINCLRKNSKSKNERMRIFMSLIKRSMRIVKLLQFFNHLSLLTVLIIVGGLLKCIH